MITSLHLKRFGAFIDRELPFSAITLFVGPNESGKTTIVDALCDVLCKPKTNRNAGKRLALRYGTDRDVSVDFDGEPLSIPEDAFYDLFAIRSGDLTLNVKPGSSWVETLKAELFTAGLDPKRLHAALARRASSDGGSRHNRELRQLREEQRRLDERRGVLGDRAAEARTADAAVTGLRSERSRVAAELDGVTRTLEERQRQARRRLQQAEQREAERLLQRFDELARESVAAPSDEAAPRLQALSAASDAAAQDVTRARAELEQARSRLQDMAAGAPAGRPSWAERDGAGGIASIAVLALFAGGIVGALMVIAGLPEIAAAIAGVAAAGGTVAFAASLRQRAAGVAAVRDETDRAAERLRVRRERHDQVEQELRSFLQRHGVESKEQLLLQLGSARAEEARRLEVEAELAAAARERGMPDTDTLREALREQLRSPTGAAGGGEPDEAGVLSADPYPSADEERLRARAAELRERLEQLDERLARDREQAAALSGITAAEIADLDTRRAGTERRIVALELDGRAAGIAASLFARIADESTAALDELSADIGARYTAVSGTAAAAGAVMTVRSSQPTLTPDKELPSSVHLEALEEAPLITDAYGAARPADQLSAGTRDAYSLAARLALAERAQRGPGLLILDEPFHAMDTTRMRRALRLIGRFQERTGWQLVVMTADERVALAVTTQFTAAQVHRLSVRESRGLPGA